MRKYDLKIDFTPLWNFATGLTILFVAFKLVHIIEWSWIWVLAPIWINLVFLLLVVIVLLIIYKMKG